MVTFLLLAGVTLGAIAIAIIRVFWTRQQMDDQTQQEMDRSPTQVLDPSWLDTDEVTGDLLPSRIPPALGPNWKNIAPRNRLELAVYLMRHPAAATSCRAPVIESLFGSKPLPTMILTRALQEQQPRLLPTFTWSRDAGRLAVRSARS